MGVNKYASRVRMALCNKKRVITEKKTWRKKNKKIRNCFYKYVFEDNQLA